jgi:vacuolar-type H+-ATPase subunit H
MYSGFRWKAGVKVNVIVTVISVVISLILVVVFRNKFDLDNSLIDNIIHYSLRVFILGVFSLFGLAIAEISKNKNVINEDIDNENYESSSANNESEHYINEAKLKAEKIIFEAEKEAKSINERKIKIEMQLRELIQTEREVIRNYEKEINTSKDNNIE